MKNRSALLVVASLAFGIIVIFLYVGLQRVGKTYQQGLSNVTTTINQPSAGKDVRKVRRILVQQDDGSCLEMTPDGIVRTLDSCAGQAKDVNRLADPKHLLTLFQYASQIDVEKFSSKPTEGTYTTLIIQTDKGTFTVYVPTTPGSGPGDGTIEGVIDLITGDLPQPTHTPIPGQPTATPTPFGATPPPSATPTLIVFGSPTPTPSYPPPFPFLCDFSDSTTKKKPYYVSGVICSSQPTPILVW